MPVRRFLTMRKQIARISASSALDMINAAGFAQGANQEQQKMYKNLVKIAFPDQTAQKDEWWKNPPQGLVKIDD